MQVATKHFILQYAHWNEGTLYPTWSIQPKKGTKGFYPTLPSANSPETLTDSLLKAERDYTENLGRTQRILDEIRRKG